MWPKVAGKPRWREVLFSKSRHDTVRQIFLGSGWEKAKSWLQTCLTWLVKMCPSSSTSNSLYAQHGEGDEC
uniref:Uncharacterized protein n=1 Tax=Aegilops tauschii subsp. strangulata TaxID=200361 RepID=A0A453A1Q6_AEGTS